MGQSSLFTAERDTERAMSQENVEAVRPWIDAFNRGGIEMALRFLDPEAATPPAKE